MEGDTKKECKYCLKRFKSEDNVKKHIKSVHNLENSLKCNDCGKNFARQEILPRKYDIIYVHTTAANI